ncbi:MAG: S9 family peptidase [Phycisphaerales bacterium]|nr:S9 family peptidase [Phycisphaerales bacterium]
MTRCRLIVFFLIALALTRGPTGLSQTAQPAAGGGADEPITLELIMSDPDWIGNAPENEYWADDSQSIYYSRKRPGSDERDLLQIDRTGSVLRTVSDEEMPFIDTRGGSYSSDYSWKVYTRGGNLFVKDFADGKVTQLTRTSENISGVEVMHGDKRIMFRRNGNLIVRELLTGIETQPADLRAQDDPDKQKDDKDKQDYLTAQQERLFESIRENKSEREASRERRKQETDADATRLKPWYLGRGIDIRGTDLSPDGRWMLVRTARSGAKSGRGDTMAQFITEDGFVGTRTVREKVGTSEVVGESLLLLDLETHERHDLDLSVLPGITDDPFADLEKAGEGASGDGVGDGDEDEQDGSPEKKKAEPRPVSIRRITWNRDGSAVLMQVFSQDSKDRWIASVDFDTFQLKPQHHLHDPAWISWGFADIGWLADGRTFYYLSEEDGYSHLYTKNLDDAQPQKLTRGNYEVSHVELSRDRNRLFYTANQSHPGVYEAWVLDVASGRPRQLTSLGGVNDWSLSPDETHLLISHSTATRPPELYVQSIEPLGKPKQVTWTVSDRFSSKPWVEPRVVEVPSSEAGRPIYSRLYLPPGRTEARARRPAVIFIHGAGYLQNAHHGWSYYFREFMFHTLLARRGYVVLDMDYRASAGYGRDWRTAIYRQMGTPELVDLRDGVNWLAEHCNVDPQRVGTYGGSYGGFLTLMAMFREPDLFACGAALRPVTDWAHYNHGYTANILDTPAIAPEAYERSSPIEFAQGLKNPLLICHGMQDDNVLMLDTIRLSQRLIELKKENWEVALYPVEPHAFREPTSWLDEYRRIYKLFEENLWPAPQAGGVSSTMHAPAGGR